MAGTFDRIITSLKNFDAKLDASTIKYYGMGNRKIYWNVLEKHTNRYESYRQFKADWDPNTNILNKLYKNVKTTAKAGFKDAFYLKDTKTIRGGTTDQVRDLLRRNRR